MCHKFSRYFCATIINTYSMKTYVLLHFEHKNDVTVIIKIMADQNTAGALLESPMRTAMHVSFAMSVELNCLQYLFYHNKQNFRQFSHLWR